MITKKISTFSLMLTITFSIYSPLIRPIQFAEASFEQDDSAGIYEVDFNGNQEGLDPATITDVEVKLRSGFLQLLSPAVTGSVQTASISPISFSAWSQVQFDTLTYSDAADIQATIFQCDGATQLQAKESVGADGVVDISGIPATEDCIRVEIELNQSAGPDPTLDAIRVTWDPLPVFLVAHSVQDSRAVGAPISYSIRYSVSFAESTDTVIFAELPADALGTVTNDGNYTGTGYVTSEDPTFVGSESGGELCSTGGGCTVGTTVVPQNSVYFDLGNVPSGTTGTLNYQLKSVNGLQEGITYLSTATIDSGNASIATSTQVSTQLEATPYPTVSKTANGTVEIEDPDNPGLITNYVYTGSGSSYTPVVTYEIAYSNVYTGEDPTHSGQNHETIFNPVLVDDVSDIISKLENPAICNVASSTSRFTINNGGTLSGNNITWDVSDIGHIAPGDLNKITYTVDYTGCPDDINRAYNNTVTLSSDNITDQTAAVVVYIGLDTSSGGIFAKGDRILDQQQIYPEGDDNFFLIQPHYDIFSWGLKADNTGVTRIDDVVMQDILPTETIFLSAIADIGTLYYNTSAVAAAYDYTAPTSNGWTTTVPADPSTVRQVATHISCLNSPHFPASTTVATLPGTQCSDAGGNSPNKSVGITEIQVQIDTPASACAYYDVSNTGNFEINGISSAISNDDADVAVPGSALVYSDVEEIHVMPRLGAFSPESTEVVGPTTIPVGDNGSYIITVGNNGDDIIEDTTVTVPMPLVTINGVPDQPLLFVSANGGAVDVSNLAANDEVAINIGSLAPGDIKNIEIVLNIPAGIENGTEFTLTPVITGDDDDSCIDFIHDLNINVEITGTPNMVVLKSRDESLVQTAGDIHYTIQFYNDGGSPSSNTYILEAIPDKTSFKAAYTTGTDDTFTTFDCSSCEVYFSDKIPPLPTELNLTDPMTVDIIEDNFVLGTDTAGVWSSPYGADTTWVAYKVDNPALDPPQVKSGLDTTRDTIGLTLTNDDDGPGGATGGSADGTLIANVSGVVSSELLLAIGSPVFTTILPDPGFDIVKSTDDEYLYAGETFDWYLDFANDSGVTDDEVEIIDTLPAGLTLNTVSVDWNEKAEQAPTSAPGGITDITADGDVTIDTSDPSGITTVTIDVDQLIGTGDVISHEGGRFIFNVTTDSTLSDGVVLTNSADANFENNIGTKGFTTTDDTVSIINPDLFIRKQISQTEPLESEQIQYTIIVSNESVNSAPGVSITDTLPAELCNVANVDTTTFQWDVQNVVIAPGAGCGQTITFELDGTASDAALVAGELPANSEDIYINYDVTVDPGTAVNTPIQNVVTVSGTITENPNNFSNTATSTATTSIPDMRVTKSAPVSILPGQVIGYSVNYFNTARADAADVYIIDTLPDTTAGVDSDGAEITILSAVDSNGNDVYYHPYATPTPAFTPGSGGGLWTTDASTLGDDIGYIAVDIGAVVGQNAGTLTVQARATDPLPTPTALLPGVTLTNSVEIFAAVDGDAGNDTDSVVTQTPGYDLVVEKTASHEGVYPGTIPGETLAYTITYKNQGTAPVCAIKITDTLDANVALVAPEHNFNTVAVTDSTEGSISLVDDDTSGSIITESITPIFTQIGSTLEWTLGLTTGSAAATQHYTNVCLPAGAEGSFNVFAQIDPSVTSGTEITNTVTITEEDGTNVDEPTEILSNNTASTSVTAYRSDIYITKTGTTNDPDNDTDPDTTNTEVSETISYNVAYGNQGDATAYDVEIGEAIPVGSCYVVGSNSAIDDATLEFSANDGVSWAYIPFADGDGKDCNVTHFRYVLGTPLPAGNYSSQSCSAVKNRIDFTGGVNSDIIIAGDESDYEVTTEVTVAAKVSIDSIPAATAQIVGRGQADGQASYQLVVDNTGQVEFIGVFEDPAAQTYQVTGPVLTLGQEYDVVGKIENQVAYLYVDGTLSATTSLPSFVNILDTDNIPRIGSPTITTVSSIDGSVWDVRIWGDARTDAELSANYLGGTVDMADADIQAYYPMNEGSGIRISQTDSEGDKIGSVVWNESGTFTWTGGNCGFDNDTFTQTEIETQADLTGHVTLENDDHDDYNDIYTTIAKISDTAGGFTAGLANDDYMGEGVMPIGDIDGDGISDIMVGVYGDDTAANRYGAMYIMFLNDNNTVKSHQKITHGVGGFTSPLGASANAYMGRGSAPLGDVDGDGVPDILISIHGEDSNRGGFYVLNLNSDGTVKTQTRIAATSMTTTVSAADSLGADLDVFDFNGDGNFDILVGAGDDDAGGSSLGAVHIILLDAAHAVIGGYEINTLTANVPTTTGATRRFGSGVEPIGDLDGDGVQDIAVGTYLDDTAANNTGSVSILFMNTNGTVKSSTLLTQYLNGLPANIFNSHEFGWGIESIPDFNDDGVIDIVVSNGNYGEMYFIGLNKDGTVNESRNTRPSHTIFTGFSGGNVQGDYFGRDVAVLPDPNGNGFTLYGGTIFDADGGSRRGAVYVLEDSNVDPYELTGTYMTFVDTPLGTLEAWGDIIVEQETPDDTSVTYTVGRQNGAACDTGNTIFPALVDLTPTNGFIDISSISNLETAICIEATLTTTDDDVTPEIKSLTTTYRSDNVQSFTFDVMVVDEELFDAEVINRATITSSTPDDDSSNNTASTTHAVTNAELQIEKEVDRTAITIAEIDGGQTINYTLTYTNNGPDKADNVTIVDALPAEITATELVSVVTTPDAQATSDGFVCALSDSDINTFDDTLTCTTASLAAGNTGTIAVTLTLEPTTGTGTWTAGDNIANTVQIDSDTFDPDETNNSDGVVTTVGAFANLYIDKDGPTTINVDSSVTYTISYGNNGNADALLSTIVDDYDPITGDQDEVDEATAPTYDFASSTHFASCIHATPTITCGGAGVTIGAGETGSFTITLQTENDATLVTNNQVLENDVTITTTSAEISITDNDDRHESTFYPSGNGTISGHVFKDDDLDGVFATGTLVISPETPIQGVSVFVAGADIFGNVYGPDKDLYPSQYDDVMALVDGSTNGNPYPANFFIKDPFVTDSTGVYGFANLTPGTYHVHEHQPGGYASTQSNAGTISLVTTGTGSVQSGPAVPATAIGSTIARNQITGITIGSGDDSVDNDFGEFLGTISGTIWEDEDYDGSYASTTDTELEAVEVTLYRDANNDGNASSTEAVAVTLTDANGDYTFADVFIDDSTLASTTDSVADNSVPYIVIVTDGNATLATSSYTNIQGFTPSADDDSRDATGYAVTLTPIVYTDTTADFGYIHGVVGNVVFDDRNGDSTYDGGTVDIPLSGVEITLYLDDGDGVKELGGDDVIVDNPYSPGNPYATTTDATGVYMFTDLDASSAYWAVVTDGATLATSAILGTYQALGGATTTGSNNVSKDSTGYFTDLSATLTGYTSQFADFGYLKLDAVAGNIVFEDLDADGIYDAGQDILIDGVDMEIYLDDGTTAGVLDGTDTLLSATTTGASILSTCAATSTCGGSVPLGPLTGTYWFDGLTTSPAGTDYLVRIIPAEITAGGGGTLDADNWIHVAGASTTADNYSKATTSYAISLDSLSDDGKVDMTADFGFVQKNGEIGGIIYQDVDSDGVYTDGTDTKINGATVTLYQDVTGSGTVGSYDAGDTLIGSTTTNTVLDGTLTYDYLFDNLDPRQEYFVGVTIANITTHFGDTNYAHATGTAGVDNNSQQFDEITEGGYEITLVASASSTDRINYTADFGYVDFNGQIGNLVYLDDNADGTFNGIDSGIGGVVMGLYLDDGDGINQIGAADTLVTSTTTLPTGAYIFDDLDPTNDYWVAVITASTTYSLEGPTGVAGVDNETQNHGGYLIDFAAANPPTNTTADFGYIDARGMIGNRVYADVDYSGSYNVGDTGIMSVEVTVYEDVDASGTYTVGDTVASTTTTIADGTYAFDNLDQTKDYVVVVTDSANILTTGGYSTVPSLIPATVADEESKDPTGYPITLTYAAPNNFTADFGYLQLNGQIGNLVFDDTNQNGVYESGTDSVIAGAEVTLYIDADVDGILDPGEIASAVSINTDALGVYTFTNLNPTYQYIVVVTDSVVSGYTPTTGTVDTDNNSQDGTGYVVLLTVAIPTVAYADFGYEVPSGSSGGGGSTTGSRRKTPISIIPPVDVVPGDMKPPVFDFFEIPPAIIEFFTHPPETIIPDGFVPTDMDTYPQFRIGEIVHCTCDFQNVIILQKLLNNFGYALDTYSTIGTLGNETACYGVKTLRSIKELQYTYRDILGDKYVVPNGEMDVPTTKLINRIIRGELELRYNAANNLFPEPIIVPPTATRDAYIIHYPDGQSLSLPEDDSENNTGTSSEDLDVYVRPGSRFDRNEDGVEDDFDENTDKYNDLHDGDGFEDDLLGHDPVEIDEETQKKDGWFIRLLKWIVPFW